MSDSSRYFSLKNTIWSQYTHMCKHRDTNMGACDCHIDETVLQNLEEGHPASV